MSVESKPSIFWLNSITIMIISLARGLQIELGSKDYFPNGEFDDRSCRDPRISQAVYGSERAARAMGLKAWIPHQCSS
jgi:hypothetical protein